MKQKVIVATSLLAALVLSGCGGGTNPSNTDPSTTNPSTTSEETTSETSTTTSEDTSTTSEVTIITDWDDDVEYIMEQVFGEPLPMIPNATSDWEFYGLTEDEQELIDLGYLNYWYSDYSTETKADDYAKCFDNSNFTISAEEDEDGPYYYFEKELKNTDTELSVAYGYIYDDAGGEDYDPSLTIEFNSYTINFLADWSDEAKALMMEHLYEVIPFAKGLTESTEVTYDGEGTIEVTGGIMDDISESYAETLTKSGYVFDKDNNYYVKSSAEKYKGHDASVYLSFEYVEETEYSDSYFQIYAWFGMTPAQSETFPTSDLLEFIGEGHSFADMSKVSFTGSITWMMDNYEFDFSAALSNDAIEAFFAALEDENYLVQELPDDEDYPNEKDFAFSSFDYYVIGTLLYDTTTEIAYVVIRLSGEFSYEVVDSFPKELLPTGDDFPGFSLPIIKAGVGYAIIQSKTSSLSVYTRLDDGFTAQDYLNVLKIGGFTINGEVATKDDYSIEVISMPSYIDAEYVYITFSAPVESVVITATTEGMPTAYGDGVKVAVGDFVMYLTDVAVFNSASFIQLKKNTGTIYNTSEFAKIDSITIDYHNTKNLVVKGGDDLDNLVAVTGTQNDDGSFTYNLGGVSYFELFNDGKGVCEVNSITFSF